MLSYASFRNSVTRESYSSRYFVAVEQREKNECEKIFRRQRKNERALVPPFPVLFIYPPPPLLIVNTMKCGILFSRQFFSALTPRFSAAGILGFHLGISSFAPSATTVQRCAFTSWQFILTSTNATEQERERLSCYGQVSFPQKVTRKMKNWASAGWRVIFSRVDRVKYVRNPMLQR